MAIAVEMPKLSDTMEEGVLVSWLAEEGEEVAAGDVIAQVETDKATMDLEVYDDGVLLKRVAGEGDAIPLGGLIAVLGDEGEDVSDIMAKYEGKGGGAAEAGAEEPEEAEAVESAEPTPAAEQQGAPAEAAPERNGRLKASPLARRLASEHEVDLARVDGSGPEGRIIKRDIEAVLEQREAAPAEAPAAAPEAAPAPEKRAYQPPAEALEVPTDELYEASKISQMRKTIARRLGQSKFTAPHFYLTVDVDVERAIAFRKELNALAEQQERGRISYNDLVTKACALALRQHPDVNASYLAEEGEIRRYEQVHVAVAVAVEEGLVTPVVRDADNKGLAQIAEETREKATLARDRKLDLSEMEGSTFTTSNLGMFGIEEFTAIINPPNSAILAIGAIRDVPVVKDGEVVPGKRMKITLSCDHRLVDGATGAAFLATVQQYLEEPMTMLL